MSKPNDTIFDEYIGGTASDYVQVKFASIENETKIVGSVQWKDTEEWDEIIVIRMNDANGKWKVTGSSVLRQDSEEVMLMMECYRATIDCVESLLIYRPLRLLLIKKPEYN